jgi:mannosyltransferase
MKLFQRPSFLQRHPWRWDIFVLVIGLCVYALLMIPSLGADSAYFDEGYSAYLAQFNLIEIAQYTARDVHPPLYYDALHFWRYIVGNDVFGLRLLSVLFGAIAIIFAFLIARSGFGRKAAWSVLPFVILSPLFIRYSEAMRMYTMVLAICGAATFVLLQAYRQRSPTRRYWLWGAYAVLVSAGMWTNYFTALVWAGHLVWVVSEYWASKKHTTDRRLYREWRIAVIAAIVLYIPWIPALVMRFADVQSNGFWIEALSVNTLVSTVTVAVTFTSAQATKGWLIVLVALFVASASWVCWQAYKQHPDKRSQLRLLAFTAITPAVLLIIMSLPPFRSSSYVYRYVLAAIFITTILIGVSMALVRFHRDNTLKKIMLYGAMILILAIGVMIAKQAGNRSLDTGTKSMMAQTIRAVQKAADSGDPILVRSPYSYYSAALYETPNHPIYYLHTNALNKAGATPMLYDHPERRGIKNIAEFAKQHDTIWIVSEERWSAKTPPVATWKKARSFVSYDKIADRTATYATEYVKPTK